MTDDMQHGTTLGAYSLFDTRTDVYLEPMFCKSRAEAERSFLNVMFKVDAIRNHCADYDLRYVGLFDTGTGQFIHDNNNAPMHVVNGLHLYKQYQYRMNNDEQVSNDAPIQSSTESGDTTQ